MSKDGKDRPPQQKLPSLLNAVVLNCNSSSESRICTNSEKMNKVADRFTEEVVDQLTEAFTRVAASLKVGGKEISPLRKS